MHFKGTTHGYLLKILITHNKKRIPILNLLINCKLAKSAHEILSIKDERYFRFSNFLIIGLYNSSTNCWSGIFSLLTPPPKILELGDFFIKNF